MENLIVNLDEILKSIQKLKNEFQHLTRINETLEVQLSLLKVEAEQYKQEISQLKKEQKENEGTGDASTLLATSDVSLQEEVNALKQIQKVRNEQIKLQLDGFVEEIDQCIQIIQAKE